MSVARVMTPGVPVPSGLGDQPAGVSVPLGCSGASLGGRRAGGTKPKPTNLQRAWFFLPELLKRVNPGC